MKDPKNIETMTVVEYTDWLRDQNPMLLNKFQKDFLLVAGTGGVQDPENTNPESHSLSPTWDAGRYGLAAYELGFEKDPDLSPPIKHCPACLQTVFVESIGEQDDRPHNPSKRHREKHGLK